MKTTSFPKSTGIYSCWSSLKWVHMNVILPSRRWPCFTEMHNRKLAFWEKTQSEPPHFSAEKILLLVQQAALFPLHCYWTSTPKWDEACFKSCHLQLVAVKCLLTSHCHLLNCSNHCVCVCVCYLYSFNKHAQIMKITKCLSIRYLLQQTYNLDTISYYLTALIKTNLVVHLTGLDHG